MILKIIRNFIFVIQSLLYTYTSFVSRAKDYRHKLTKEEKMIMVEVLCNIFMRLGQYVLKYISSIAQIILSSISFLLLLTIGLFFIFNFLKQPYSPENYRILFSAIGIAATLCGLSFRASSTSKVPIRKALYFASAENFLRATIAFFVATIFQYVLILPSVLGNIFPQILKYVIPFLEVFIKLQFIYGIYCFLRGFSFIKKRFIVDIDLDFTWEEKKDLDYKPITDLVIGFDKSVAEHLEEEIKQLKSKTQNKSEELKISEVKKDIDFNMGEIFKELKDS